MAMEFKMEVLQWSSLAFGLLTGKYDPKSLKAAIPRAGGLPPEITKQDEKRVAGDKLLVGSNPFGDTLFTEHNWQIIEVLCRIVDETA